jgi:hypothetical protein
LTDVRLLSSDISCADRYAASKTVKVHTGMVRNVGRWAVVGGLALVLLGSWAGYHQSEPDFASIPAGPTTRIVVDQGDGSCVSVNPDDIQERRGNWWAHGLVTVDSSPIGVTAMGLPGPDSQPCQDHLTQFGRSIATTLADGIRSSPKYPSGLDCPADNTGAQAVLFFHYSGGGVPEVVNASLSGCPGISAPGMGSRLSDAAFTNELDRVATAP